MQKAIRKFCMHYGCNRADVVVMYSNSIAAVLACHQEGLVRVSAIRFRDGQIMAHERVEERPSSVVYSAQKLTGVVNMELEI